MSVVPDDLRWVPDLTSRDVGFKRIEDIAFTPMSARLRNELITQAYGDLAQAMAELVGSDDATWAGFGQWASRTIGGYLNLPIPGLGYIIGRAFGDGNRDVFADIGRAHATFLATVGEAHATGANTNQAWRECRRQLRLRLMKPPGGPGGGTEDEFWASVTDPRLRPEGRFHNQLLVLGFQAYLRAMRTNDPEERSRRILTGNCLIALHEQKLLSLAISIGFRSWLRTITTPWRLMQTRHAWRNRDPHQWRIRLEHRWIRFATKRLIGVALHTGTVRTGKPLPAGNRPIDVDRVPIEANENDDDNDNEGVDDGDDGDDINKRTLLGKLFTKLDVDGRPASCWNSLTDRMAFIVALFAQHQRADYWFDEQGVVVRPEPWSRFERELADQIASMDMPPIDEEPPDATPSPLTDEQLDELRTKPTHLQLGNPETLTFRSVADEKQRHRFGPVRSDVADRYAQISQGGQHLDAETCRTARRIFKRWSTLWFMGLLFRSLPDSYAGAAGVHVLGRVSDLATDPFRRAGETAQFVVDLLQTNDGWNDGRMESDGPAFRSVTGVRGMHSIVANRLLNDDWDTSAHGVPLNQEDALGAALTFGVSAVEMLDRLGIKLNKKPRDSYVQFWLGIGFLLGAPYEAITVDGPSGRQPLDYGQARALALAIRRRHHARSLDGVRLTEALIDGVADGFPRSFGWMSSGLMKVLGESRITSLLLVGGQRGRRRSAVLAAAFRLMLRFRITRPPAQWLIRGIGRMWMLPFLEQGRTHPYRRPRRAIDERRIRRAEKAVDYWPLSCVSGEAQPPQAEATPRRGRRRQRRLVA